jgi:hypothetical protein
MSFKSKSLGTRYESIIFLHIALTKAHKVRWDDWSRADGTKTTWEDGSRISAKLWNNVQRRIRQEKAATSLEIAVLHTTDMHNTLTYLRNQGGLEMAKRLKKEPQPNFLEEMNKNIAYQQEIGNLPASYTGNISKAQRSSIRQKTGSSLASSSSSTLLSSRSMQSSIASSSMASATLKSSSRSPSLRSSMKRSKKRVDSSDSDTSVGPSVRPFYKPVSPTASQSRPVPVIERFNTPAMRLVVSPLLLHMSIPLMVRSCIDVWSFKIYGLVKQKNGVLHRYLFVTTLMMKPSLQLALISVISRRTINCRVHQFTLSLFDDLSDRFYISAIGVTKPSDDFLVKCFCHECLDATACSCQDVSEIADGDGNRVFAYTRSVRIFIYFNLSL